MARSIAEIKEQIVSTFQAQPALSGITSPSQTAIWNTLAYVFATCVHFHERYLDISKAEQEQIAAKAVPGTRSWLQDKVLKFQFGDVVQLVDFAPVYPEIDPEKYIVSRCSVIESGDKRNVLIKVAKGQLPDLEPLTEEEQAALKSYVDTISFAGVATQVISLNPDRLKVTAQIYYDGQYVQSTVKEAVKTAISTFLFNLDFAGTMYLSRLEDAIQSVPGVRDVKLIEVKGREAQNIGNVPAIQRLYIPSAGYMIPEDNTGSTLDDTIEMILF